MIRTLAVLLIVALCAFAEPSTYETPLPVADTRALPHTNDTLVSTTISVQKSSLEDTVQYSADTIRFRIADEALILTGRARVHYQSITLTAHSITLQSTTKNLVALGKYFLVNGDTLWTNTPKLEEKDGAIEGFKMVYNLETKRGRITQGNTSFEEGHYQGSTIALVGNKELNTCDGNYSTCAFHDDPHYTFHSKQMKLYINDKAILKPVVLTFQDIPVIALPFYILPLKQGRHSGLLMPRYGEDNLYGKYLKNIGYYYAPSPYWDTKLSMGFYSSARNQLELATRYNLRYVLRGSFKSSFLYDAGAGTNATKRRWDLIFNHSHELAPGWTMKGYGTFVSDRSYFNDYRETVAERSEKNLRSGAYITRRGEKTTTTITALHTKNFLPTTTTTHVVLPKISFNAGGQVIPASMGRQSRNKMWYRKLRYAYANNYEYTLSRASDTTLTDTGSYHHAQIFNQRVGLNYSGTLFAPWLNITPKLQYTELYNYVAADSNYQNGTYSLSTHLSTALYGIFPVNIRSLEVLRHTFRPSTNITYARTFREYNKIYQPLFAGTPDKAIRTMGIGFNNLFQAKIERDSTTIKPTLLTGPNISTSYNFDTKQWNDIKTDVSTTLGKFLTVNVHFAHSLYQETGNALLATTSSTLLRELSRTITITSSGAAQGNQSYYNDIRRFSNDPFYSYAGTPLTTTRKPWDVSAGYRIVHTQNKAYTSKTQNLTGRASYYLTRNLKATYRGIYNLTNNEFVSQQIELFRNLHCWEARLSWTPTGYRRGFFFKVNIKDIPDIKVEQSIKY